MSDRTILIFGAGAIGRGYLPWVFRPDRYRLSFVEVDPRLRRELTQRGRYTTHMAVNGEYLQIEVPVDRCFAPGDELADIQEFDVIATAVGPRNFFTLRESLSTTRAPVICFENDSSIASRMRSLTRNERVVFAVPDVITSSTAPPHLLAVDPLSIVTESGTCFIEESVGDLEAECQFVSPKEMQAQWLAKLYIHNTPHCIAAYLGDVSGVTYVHEAMEHEGIVSIVEGSMGEVAAAVRARYRLDNDFVSFYRNKELARFRNQLLFDPISRVAREPFRKLAPNERLLGAAQMCLAAGIRPDNLLIGIMAAFAFSPEGDPDAHIAGLRRSLPPADFLSTILRLREGEALYELLLESWGDNLERLESVR